MHTKKWVDTQTKWADVQTKWADTTHIQHIQMNNFISSSSNLVVDIIKETTLEMIVQKKINCMLNYIIDLTLLTSFQ